MKIEIMLNMWNPLTNFHSNLEQQRYLVKLLVVRWPKQSGSQPRTHGKICSPIICEHGSSPKVDDIVGSILWNRCCFSNFYGHTATEDSSRCQLVTMMEVTRDHHTLGDLTHSCSWLNSPTPMDAVKLRVWKHVIITAEGLTCSVTTVKVFVIPSVA